MTWVKGDNKWHYAEEENVVSLRPIPRKGCTTTCGIFLPQKGLQEPIDSDPKCHVCDEAHPS